MKGSPASNGYRMPAEWERHAGTWIGWPHNVSDWLGKFSAIPWAFAEIVRKISAGEIVNIIAVSRAHEASARRVLAKAGADLSRTKFFLSPTDRGWTRDFGPIFVTRGGETAIVDFRFTGWAKYPNWKKDNAVHGRAAKALRLPLLDAEIEGKQFVLEGGAIDVNGRGTVMVTEECLLDQKTQVRNPGAPREAVERALGDSLGAQNVLWLGRGIAGDDTHGHIDDIARFAGPRTIVACAESNSSDVNYAPLNENMERLAGMRLEDGSRPEVVPIPMPSPLHFSGLRLPASYANFYIANAAVIVPTFNDANDRKALGILGELFSDRPVVGIHAVDLVWGFGTLHCLTQQQPG